jgi:hypothetical protein
MMGKQIRQLQPNTSHYWEIATGEIDNATAIDKFGLNPSVSTSYETIWDAGAIYAYPSSAVAMTVTSASGASDNGVEVTIIGLDADYDETQQTVTLGGLGVATTTQTFIRVFRAFVSSGQAATGVLDIDNSGTVYAQIQPDFQQTMMALYTIPAGYVGYLVSGNLSSTKDKDITAKLMMREVGGAFRVKGLVLSPGTPFQRQWVIPQAIPEKTDIEVRAKVGATGPVAAGFEIVLVKD